jgi:O-succinylbenzoic acid--CoA ligase
MKNNQYHIDFKLNGNSFSSVDELLAFANKSLKEIYPFLQDWFSDSDVIMVKTSGSTGKPKAIELKKEFMRNSAIATGTFFSLPEKTTALLCMSSDYIAGKMMLVRALVLGWHMDVVLPVSNPLKGLEKIYDFSAMVPMQLQNSLSEIHRIKKLIVGGGIVSQELEQQIQEVSIAVFATFGMTETITHIAVKKLNHKSGVGKSHYKLLPNVTISTDQRNCLVIHAPKVSEYINITNDVVEIISDTEFNWLGRYDNVINSGGIKLHPEEIEKKLSQVISQRFFVTGIADEILGEKLVLVIEGEPYHLFLDNTENLSKYETPKDICFVTQFVETETKKIQRNKTLDLLFK